MTDRESQSDDGRNAIAIARHSLLDPTGLEEAHLDRALNALMRGGVDNADLYFQVTRHESWSLEDGIVKEGSYNLDQGSAFVRCPEKRRASRTRTISCFRP